MGCDQAREGRLPRPPGELVTDTRPQLAEREPLDSVTQCITPLDVLVQARRLYVEVPRHRCHGDGVEAIAVSDHRSSCQNRRTGQI
jgi:hypothetical protein